MQYAPKTDPALMLQEPDLDDITDEDLGIPLRDKYPWLENWILDVENKTITHRPDMFGHFGLSVELHSIFGSQAPSFVSGKKYMEQMQHGSVMEMLAHATESKVKVHAKSDLLRTYTLIELEDKVTIGGSVHIICHYAAKGFLVIAPVKIRKGATLGLKATVMGDVEIGENAVIAPHEVVYPKSRVAADHKPAKAKSINGLSLE